MATVLCCSADTIERISEGSITGAGWSEDLAISTSGDVVAFSSGAPDLVAGDSNVTSDIFVYDRIVQQIKRVSIASDGSQGSGDTYHPAISGNGRFVGFVSSSEDLIASDTNNFSDTFVHDRVTGLTERVSVATDGSQGIGTSFEGISLSSDGRYVAFRSWAGNLVESDTNGATDIFLRDRQSGETTRISVSSDGTQADGFSYDPSLSGDGRYVVFTSSADNLVPGDSNNQRDVFLRDLVTGETRRINVAGDGGESNGESSDSSISSDGRYVSYYSLASNLVVDDNNETGDVFVYDTQTQQTNRSSVSSTGTEGNDRSLGPTISADGRYVAFLSQATNLVSGDTNGKSDAFIHDRITGSTTRVSLTSDGAQANDDSSRVAISGGQSVAFASNANNLETGDNNGGSDIFFHEVIIGQTSLISESILANEAGRGSFAPHMNSTGRFVVFQSKIGNVSVNDGIARTDIFFA